MAYPPPTKQEWRKFVRKARQLFPPPIPVKVVHSPSPPFSVPSWWCGGFWCWYKGGRLDRAVIWIDSRLPRVSAVDALLHEWAHLLREEELQDPSGECLHDDAFWTTFGELFRTWTRVP